MWFLCVLSHLPLAFDQELDDLPCVSFATPHRGSGSPSVRREPPSHSLLGISCDPMAKPRVRLPSAFSSLISLIPRKTFRVVQSHWL